MTPAPLPLNEPLLDASEEITLAKQIEAGLFAQHLLDHDRHGIAGNLLIRVADQGVAAWERFFSANLRLAMYVSSAETRRYETGLDDVFQEACLGLAAAVMRWDYRRGTRFSTFAYHWIRQRANAAALTRGGRADAPLSRLRKERSLRAADPNAEVLSVAPTVLADLDVAQPPEDPFSQAPPWWFTLLHRRERTVLSLRYGVGTKCHTIAQVAAQLGLSSSKVRRLEAAALSRTRTLIAEAD